MLQVDPRARTAHNSECMQLLGREVGLLSGLTCLRLERLDLHASAWSIFVTSAGFRLGSDKQSGSSEQMDIRDLEYVHQHQPWHPHFRPRPASAVPLLQSLRLLSFSCSNLDDAAMQPVASMLRWLEHLTHQDLSYNSIAVPGSKLLSRALSGSAGGGARTSPCNITCSLALTNLQILNLQNCVVDGDRVLALEAVLCQLVSMRKLTLNAREWGDGKEQHTCARSLQRVQIANPHLSIAST